MSNIYLCSAYEYSKILALKKAKSCPLHLTLIETQNLENGIKQKLILVKYVKNNFLNLKLTLVRQ